MIRNGAEVIHLATGMVVGYPPCPRLPYFAEFIRKKFGVHEVIGTHPVPQNYYTDHVKLGTWDNHQWNEMLLHTMADKKQGWPMIERISGVKGCGTTHFLPERLPGASPP
jgi:hypothetical protein